MRPRAAGTGHEARGGPDFKLWYDGFRRATGNPYRRAAAAACWADLAMNTGEARWLMRFTQEHTSSWGRSRRAPNAGAFLEFVWAPTLRRARAKKRSADPMLVREGLATVYAAIRGRA